ncbi:MAG: N-6 DNA methylase [Acidobacteriota bacterium]|nr:N-6 DNA methylase [Acidobacteriota bacterium]
MDLKRTEEQRILQQVRLDSLKAAEERNKWGQFATPPQLARAILEYARLLWTSDNGPIRFLDPALGTGSFFSALAAVFPAHEIETAVGIELDDQFATVAEELWRLSGLTVVAGDFTKLEPPKQGRRFNLVVSNPPYVRHHHLDGSEKERLRGVVRQNHNIVLSGLAGLYCYFLLLCDSWLEPNGMGIWLIPSEFMDVNYGDGVKRYLTQKVELLHVHRFSPSDVQFSDALVSSAIVVFRKIPPTTGHLVRMSFGGSLLTPDDEACVPLEELCSSRKWTRYPQSRAPELTDVDGILLGDLFTIKRGLATGSNEFFIVGEELIKTWNIPDACLRPILPGPRHLSGDVVEADEYGVPQNCIRQWLIDTELPGDVIQGRYPRFWDYLDSGKDRKIPDSYLASRRRPWYSQERREPAPFLFTYMGRSRNGGSPFRVIWNKSKATAHNVYLLLYPRALLWRALQENPDLYPVLFEYLRKIESSQLVEEGRVYGGGLHKLEPRELARVSVVPLLTALSSRTELAQFVPGRQLSLVADR